METKLNWPWVLVNFGERLPSAGYLPSLQVNDADVYSLICTKFNKKIPKSTTIHAWKTNQHKTNIYFLNSKEELCFVCYLLLSFLATGGAVVKIQRWQTMEVAKVDGFISNTDTFKTPDRKKHMNATFVTFHLYFVPLSPWIQDIKESLQKSGIRRDVDVSQLSLATKWDKLFILAFKTNIFVALSAAAGELRFLHNFTHTERADLNTDYSFCHCAEQKAHQCPGLIKISLSEGVVAEQQQGRLL